jgi:diguanylate cyclase (GGDEF)-like protein
MLRFMTGLARLPPDTSVGVRFLNEGAFQTVLIVAMAGIAQLQRTQTKLEQLATHDPLTGALNARSFVERLTQELERIRRYSRPLALLYLDLDDFKVVNDRHGHQTGDAVLRLVANATRRALRQSDVIGRLGGDEFGVLMPETDGAVAEAAALRLVNGIRAVFQDAFGHREHRPRVHPQRRPWGPAAAPPRRLAMYEAKRSGKDRVVQVTI